MGIYKIIETGDKSPTLWSEAFDENCHSVDGAQKETRYIYIEGCELQNKALKGEVNILEVGFGAGHGFKETFDFFKTKHPQCLVHFYSFEIDEDLIPWSFKKIIKLPLPQKINNNFQGGLGNFSFTILIGDARKRILDFPFPAINAIYQDAFSPLKNHALWTVEWFEDLKKISANDLILTTYSASSKIKKSLIEAGFGISERVGFGGKRGSIRADLTGIVSQEIILKLKRSPEQALHDHDKN